MSLARLKIYRGEDKKPIFKIRLLNGDPLDLQDVTHITAYFEKADRTFLVLGNNLIAAKKASALVSDLAFSAVTAGANGNNIALSFDGVDTVQIVIDAWNTANPLNQVSVVGDASVVLPAQNIQLVGGYDAYIPIEVLDARLGKIRVTLIDYDTTGFRVGTNQSVKFIVDFGEPPLGTRYITYLKNRLDVYN